MGIVTDAVEHMNFNRERTVGLLDEIAAMDDPEAVLGWRPGPGRAHIAWQLMHVGVTEELFATERLIGETAGFANLAPRFKGGSTPDDEIPTREEIRHVLEASRSHLLETIGRFTDDDLDTVPEGLEQRGWTIGQALQILAWHEPHHQGQAHITRNLWQASNGAT